ncbi:hypothetical protein [Actinoplanes utahensis]|uniref:hypothetical protein n=1 Tax=Actinoplanes utahensis TaxID=1869 RepID=UPI0007C65920|nr:hypothetical protein [Actinoplanes utahensis]GIF27328.1 hypothetical protein Aut01nite_03140 [Actinoplanes utahensis]
MFDTDFLRPGRILALVTAALSVVAAGVLTALGTHAECPGACPTTPVAADGGTVGDRFWFLHRDLGPQGSITVRMTSMTGTITYPPPGHDEIVPGLVPWAKSGIIVKDGLRQGSRYAAMMMTGSHGVRFQHDYRHDVAGREGGVSAESPRWLRLTRSGDTVTGAESADGARWHTVGTARLDGLPDTVQVGLFAASPGDLTLRRVALGGVIPQARFTQAVGVFDNVTVVGGATGGNGASGEGGWASDSVGEMNHTDWERFHHRSGAVQSDGVIRVSGTGDIGPADDDAPRRADQLLLGLVVALIVVLVVAARYGTGGWSPRRAIAVGAATLVTGLIAVGTVLPLSSAIARSRHLPLETLPLVTGIRMTVGIAVVLALCAVLAYLLGTRMRRAWAAAGVAVSLIAVPYVVTALPLLPDPVAQWLLRVTPAAAFAVEQVAVEYPQVTAHYAPSAGYFPLPWWAGLLVLGAYVAVFVRLVTARPRRAGIPSSRSGGPGGERNHSAAETPKSQRTTDS